MKSYLRKLFFLLQILILTACGAKPAIERYELIPYQDPAGIFRMPYPEGWQVKYDDATQTATFTPPVQVDEVHPLVIRAVAQKTASETWDESGEEVNKIFEQFLRAYFPDESPEIYLTDDLRVGKEPALVMEFAQPYEDGYFKGSIVLVVLRGYAIGFIGSAVGDAWDSFKPTFKQMLLDVEFLN